MSQYRVFITRKIMDEGVKLLKAQGYEVVIYDGDGPISLEELYKEAKKSHAIIPMLTEKIDKKFLNENKHLKVVANYAVGFNNIDLQEATKLGIPASNTPDVLSNATADLALTLLVSVARNVVPSMQSIYKGQWKAFNPLGFIGQSLVNKTIGIVGMGRIGYQLAKRCHKGWDMKVLYFDSMGRSERAEKDFNAQFVSLNELLSQSDFVSVHVPLTNETKEMFNKDLFSKMKKNAIFINTSRGDTHNQKDLYDALVNKTIWGAGLDVTNPEPMSKDDPMLRLPNVVITPHIASADEEARQGMSRVAAQNVIAALKNQQIPQCLNPEVYKLKQTPKL